ncbi:unnamed protein product [Caretta caretta]
MLHVYIRCLSYHVQEEDIQHFFSSYGRLLKVNLKNGYGFVEFKDSHDTDDAIYELNGKDLCRERVIVEHAQGPRQDAAATAAAVGVVEAVDIAVGDNQEEINMDHLFIQNTD